MCIMSYFPEQVKLGDASKYNGTATRRQKTLSIVLLVVFSGVKLHVLGERKDVLISEVSSFQGLNCM